MIKCFQVLFLVLLCCSFSKAEDISFSKNDSLIITLDSAENYPRNFWKPINLSKSDTTVHALIPTRNKHFWRASPEWFLPQAFPATFNRFITRDPYSYISFQNFLTHQRISAWDWDDNQFTTNQID